ncbi:hypothetical protein AB6T38_14215 [Aliiglaciecola sp. SL4]|uniref:hypothetical protein n=1 Tax=Aliiglaciecola sp. SL4 TaxID=3239806 RepID=UPI00355B298D
MFHTDKYFRINLTCFRQLILCLSVAFSVSIYAEDMPSFEQFKVSEISPMTLKEVDFDSHTDGVYVEQSWHGMMATVIGESANFAGKFYILGSGCGTGCQHNLVINVETGKIIDTVTSGLGLCHQADSSLLIVNPRLNDFGDETPDWAFTYYYQFDGSEFRLLHKIRSGYAGECVFGQ